VALSMLKAFPGAPLYTALYAPDTTYPEFAGHDIRSLWTNRIRSLRRDHRRGLPLYPKAFSGLRIDADVVLCSSSGFAHGVNATGHKVVYCYTPPRWLYDQATTYMSGWPSSVSAAVRPALPAMRQWDRRAAATADSYLTSSTVVRARIHDAYGIDATVVPPPAPAAVRGARQAVPGVEAGFVLCVSRLLAYKNVHAVVAAFDSLPAARLVVVGDGPERSRLQGVAGHNVRLLGTVDDAELAWLYANCAGVVAASYEDFGLTAIEATSCGKPVAALHAGGFLDTVRDGETGLFFDRPEGPVIARTMERMLGQAWDAAAMARHAEYFTEVAFADRLTAATRSTAEVASLGSARSR
jgi:glycosyltransferase involved in cell wall biosynthesis